MNREIKFRAWDKIDKEMFRVIMLTAPQGKDYLIVSGRGGSTTTDKGNCILMQFTGLKDKNGKEIYEGDIVRIRHEEDMHEHEEEGCEKGCTFGDDAWKTIEVKWDSEIAGYFFDSEALFGHEYNLPIVTEGYETEIIGNIYENPELLK